MAVRDVVTPSPQGRGKQRPYSGEREATHQIEKAPDAPISTCSSFSPRSLSRPLRTLRFTGRALDIAVCAGAYLYGSVPLVYLLARQRRVDLKRV
ncbi:MAG TPA: hypothetical protein VKT52_03960, partial [Ktedonobacterales bacterium]|nr:hypothetical protein [Ktedonobacterales bacterium]